jgi:hypothetical protein
MDEGQRIIHWNSRLEEYFAQTGEKAHCLSWLHKKSEAYYTNRAIVIDLPVIILGTLNGATSIGSSALFGDDRFASVGVGIVALITAILTTIGTYFSWSRRSEGHKIASLSYSKLYRFLSIEMSLPRHERMTPNDLLKYVRVEYDRLSEVSPLINPTILNTFNKKFEALTDIAKPEEANGLHPINIYADPTATPHPSSSAVNIQMRPPQLQPPPLPPHPTE